MFKKLFKSKEKQPESILDQIIEGLNRRYSKQEWDLEFNDLRDYEQYINQRIRSNDKYKILHNKLILVSPLDLVARLYYYDNKRIVIVGEVSFLPDNKYITIRDDFNTLS